MNYEIIIKELQNRFHKDQQALHSDKFNEISKENTLFLKDLINKIGWPSEEKVGKQGELAAWLISQHSDFDIGFQEECLALMKSLSQNPDRNIHIQYLTDRTLINRGKKQVYGTQGEK